MRIVVELDANLTTEGAQRLVDAIGQLRGVAGASLERREAPAGDPAELKVDERSRFYLYNVLGLAITALGPMEAALAMVLLEHPTVFEGSKELYEVLSTFPLWRGKLGQVRTVYAGLRRKLAKTRYPLTSLRGVYGFDARVPAALRAARSLPAALRESLGEDGVDG